MEERINRILDALYNGQRRNPGVTKRLIVTNDRGNILDMNVCQEPGCNCGWNIQIGSTDKKLLGQILDLLGGK